VRARVSTLSELAEDWANTLLYWSEVNAPLRREVDGRTVPDRNEELLVYQTLVGALPLNEPERPHFRERLQDYVVKAAREAKVWSSWLSPDEAYEQALTGFVADLLDDGNARFWESFWPFHANVERLGAFGSLAQVVLKLCAPGVPDLYQGTEAWNLRLVDPDNRVPVDYGRRAQAVAEARERWEQREQLGVELLEQWRDGRIKVFVTHACLQARRRRPALFAEGDYQPLDLDGPLAEHAVAFARTGPDGWAIALAPRLVGALGGAAPVGGVWWETALLLPDDAPTRFVDALSGRELEATGGRLRLADVLARFPVALLEA
jgi:(1->4)-alpha-D-glucan 1-alpha-D-glucosylmutase